MKYNKLFYVLVFVLAFAIPLTVFAQRESPAPQSSHILVQNLDADDATVHVDVYDETGAVVASDNFTIDGNGATTVHSTSGTNVTGHRYLNLTSGFQGSMVVSSDKEVVAVNVTVGGTPPTSHSAYESISSADAAEEVLVPSIHWKDAQWSWVAIQNTGSVQATAVYTYYKQDGTVLGGSTASLLPGESEILDIYDEIDIGTVPEGVGSMQVTGSEPLGVAVVETIRNRTEAYIGFPSTAGDTYLAFPSIHHNPHGQYSHMLVQNVSATAATVYLQYYDQAGNELEDYEATIGADGSLTFHTNAALSDDGNSYEPHSMGNVGSAIITSTQPLVAVNVEVIGLTPTTVRPYAYNGFRSDSGSDSLLFPSVHMNPGGQYSHLLVQNLLAASTPITLTYYDQSGVVQGQHNYTFPPNGALTFHTTTELSEDGNNYSPAAGFGNVGSAVIEGPPGSELIGVNVETLRGVPNVYSAFSQ
jgi:hypothetical protein